MKNLPFLLILLLLISCKQKKSTPYNVIITHVNLIDGTGSAMQNNVNLYIKDGRIAAITNDLLPNVTASEIMDGSHKYVTPGFFESHFHPSKYDVDSTLRKNHHYPLQIMIHYGITSALMPGSGQGGYNTMHLLQSKAEQGAIVSPRLYFTSPFITNPGGHPAKTYPEGNWVDGQNIYFLKDTSQVKPIIKAAAENNAAGIKLMVEDGPTPPFIERLKPVLIRKVASEAHKAGLPVLAHISDDNEVRIGLQNGVDHFAHFLGIRIDWIKDRALVAEMGARHGSWITTLALGKSLIYYHIHPEWLERPEIKNIYDSTLLAALIYDGMQEDGKATLKAFTGTDTVSLKQLITPWVKDLIRLSNLGINIALGTDVGGDDYVFAGLSMHEEMAIMQMGGVPPLQIIKMATYNPALMLNLENDYGSLEKGKVADFLLLAKNPLKDIRNTLSIERVYKAGVRQPRIN